MKIFAERLIELRKEKNLSHKELGKALNINGSTISRWENNLFDAKAEEIAKVANFFGVTADYLLGLED